MSAKWLLPALALAGCAPVSQQNAAISVPPASDWLTQCEGKTGWDDAGPPFRIHGNSYYVGTCGIAVILIASPGGHIVIDSGTEAGADIVVRNIQTLGFRLSDVKILLHSHEHIDHVGGMAKLQKATGARVMASPAAAAVMKTGKDSPDDPQYGLHPAMQPVANVQMIGSDSVWNPGNAQRMIRYVTPGHTPGALTWQWRSCAVDQAGQQDCKTIVYVDSLNPISRDGYRFSDHPAYLAAFRAGLAAVAVLDCDILITPHPGSSDMAGRLASPAGLVDNQACSALTDRISARLDARLAAEAAGTAQ